MHAYTYMYMCMYVHIYVRMYFYVYIYTYICIYILHTCMLFNSEFEKQQSAGRPGLDSEFGKCIGQSWWRNTTRMATRNSASKSS